MKSTLQHTKWIFVALLAVVLASCQPTGVSDKELAATYAAQTLAAMPNKTAAPKETQMPEAASTATATPEPTLGPVGPIDFPENVNPLTGMKVDDPLILDRRPVLIKVANYPASGRPHAGLSFADIVFEYYIGYGGNRFIALYYGQDASQIGPVRSGRLVDPQIVSLYQGIFGFESAYVTIYNHILDVLGNRAINGSGGNICPAICDTGENIVTSKFADSEAMTELSSQRGVDNKRYTLEGIAFDPQAPNAGQEGEVALILYSNLNRGEWRFDEESGKYLRWIEDTTGGDLEMIPLVDRITEEQLAFSNVVVLFAYNDELAPTLHDIYLWDNPTGNRAVVFRDGQAYDVTWATPNKDQPIRFFDQDGEAFPLKPGNTWMVIMGLNSDDTQDEGNWTFTYYLP
jgi:hypothetical protein